MYQLQFLPIAKKDMENIVYYVAYKLNNDAAAKELAKSFIDGAKSILNFPFGSSIYTTSEKLKYEYRCIKIKNFLMFYIIDDDKKIITVVRVLYKKMNIEDILD